MKILVTGSNGFISGYLISELLNNGHKVIGIDNYSKYGKVEKSYDNHKNYSILEGDCKNIDLMKEAISDCDHLIMAAAMIGGISYFHTYAYDLLAENERILASSFDAAIWAHKNKKLKKATVLSSSMVFENTSLYPSPEGEQLKCPPPFSTYGFQKLSSEYFALGAWQQYKLPYTILRPFNCIGIGEHNAIKDHNITSGNIKLAMSHVVPDLVKKILLGQDPLHILGSGQQIRHYTYGGDLAKGIYLSLENKKALNQDFNLSINVSTSVLELAKIIWKKIHGTQKKFSFVSDEPFIHDVKKRIPDTKKASNLLNFNATTSLDKALDEIIPWVKENHKS